MTEIDKVYYTLKNKDEAKQKYYFRLSNINEKDNTAIIAVPLSKNATGADLFKQWADFAKANLYDTLKYEEFSQYQDFAEPYTSTLIPLKSGGIQPKNRKQKNNTNKQPNTSFNGFGTLGDIYTQLQGQFGSLFENEREKSDLRNTNVFLQRDLSKANSEIETLKKENESLKKENEKYKDKQRSFEDEKKKFEERTSLLGLISTGIMGVISQRVPMANELLSGLGAGFGANASQEHDQEQQSQNEENQFDFKPETEAYLKEILKYLNGKDLNFVVDIYQIINLIAQNESRIKEVFAGFQRVVTLLNNKPSSTQLVKQDFKPEQDETDSTEDVYDNGR